MLCVLVSDLTNTLGAVIAQQVMQHSLVIVQELFCNGVVLRIFIFNLVQSATIEKDDFRSWVRQQNRRMRCNDELDISFH